MLNSTNWVGYLSAVMLVGVSFAAVFLGNKPGAGDMTVVDANFLGTQSFGAWTLVCESLQPRPAPGAAAAAPRRICRSNAVKRVRVNGKNLLAAGFNVMYAGPIRGPAVLFRLPPAASAGDHVDFAIDNNTMFEAPMGRCNDNECIVQGVLPSEALAEMKAGRILSLMYTATVGQETRNVRVDQVLDGFPQIVRCPDESDGVLAGQIAKFGEQRS